MPKTSRLLLFILCSLPLSSCSPRDYLTRRLATDLIAASATFRAPQQFQLRIGVVSSKDYDSADDAPLQHHGWISVTQMRCPPDITPPPCVDVELTPEGVRTFQSLIAPGDIEKRLLTISATQRELVAVTGIAEQKDTADVEFTWKWIPLNEVGALFYAGEVHYRSTVGFRSFDDGWRVVQNTTHYGQPLDEALKNSEPAQ